LQSTVADKNAKAGKFFFNLRTKGEPVKISAEAIKVVAIAEGRVDAEGNMIEEVKPIVDPVDKAMQARLKSGAVNNVVVVNKDKKSVEETVYKLKVKGG
jgi:hypothetical protein